MKQDVRGGAIDIYVQYPKDGENVNAHLHFSGKAHRVGRIFFKFQRIMTICSGWWWPKKHACALINC